jgi:hypothetical protein
VEQYRWQNALGSTRWYQLEYYSESEYQTMIPINQRTL